MIERGDLLERRVRWLDRHRRSISILAGAAIVLLVAHELPYLMGEDWPRLHASATSLAAGALGWLVVEIALAYVIAVWESEIDRLLLGRGLPRAELRSRRWGK